MYKIRFDYQTESGIPDRESCSIVLTKEQYDALPEMSVNELGSPLTLIKEDFPEQVRNPHKFFPAIWFSNPAWQLNQPANFECQYANPEYKWVFVCLDIDEDIWIAFKYWDATTNEEMMSSSTVGVTTPWHGYLYRLDEYSKHFVKPFF